MNRPPRPYAHRGFWISYSERMRCWQVVWPRAECTVLITETVLRERGVNPEHPGQLIYLAKQLRETKRRERALV